MYIATVPNRNSKPAILLRESHREGKKVSTKTLANLTNYAPERIQALKRALKGDFDGMGLASLALPKIGKTYGTYFILKYLADEIGVTKSLKDDVLGKLSLFLILTRIAHRGSRLSAVRFAEQHAVEDILGLDTFNEDNLYKALDYLCLHQEDIEQKLYKTYLKNKGNAPILVLYDVTSSYFEGEHNELAAFGYNRDGKKGKKQIVIGLLADTEGEPLAVRVFEGNTSDPSTVMTQINLLKEQFKIQEVIFVGDRGMVKTKAQEALNTESYAYITALTDAQVRTLLKEKILQYDFFDTPLHEVESEGKRYILMRNDAVCSKEEKRRSDKLKKLESLIQKRNTFVKESSRASAEGGMKTLQAWLKKYKMNTYITLSLREKEISYSQDLEAQIKHHMLDGCYVIVTDVKKETLTAKEVHQSYMQLQRVERDFRTLKTGFLEVRPIFVRKKERTKGHVLVSMLALKIVRYFRKKLEEAEFPYTLQDALDALGRYVFLEQEISGNITTVLPRPDAIQTQVFNALGIKLPLKAALTSKM